MVTLNSFCDFFKSFANESTDGRRGGIVSVRRAPRTRRETPLSKRYIPFVAWEVLSYPKTRLDGR